MTLEKILKENLNEVVRLAVGLFPNSSTEEELLYYQNLINNDSETCFLGILDQVYIGYIHLKLRTDYVEGAQSSPVAYIEAIYVDPEHRKTGIGKKLVERGEIWGREKGCSEYASDTDINNHLSIDFHKGIGFKEAGRNVCFIKKL